jgi:hypothetical protein
MPNSGIPVPDAGGVAADDIRPLVSTPSSFNLFDLDIFSNLSDKYRSIP